MVAVQVAIFVVSHRDNSKSNKTNYVKNYQRRPKSIEDAKVQGQGGHSKANAIKREATGARVLHAIRDSKLTCV